MGNEYIFKNSEGVEYKVKFRKPNKRFYGEDCDGTCDPPYSKSPKILINPNRGNKTKLNTSIHEFAHAFFWDKSEKEVSKFSNTITKFLYQQGWRKNEITTTKSTK
jgi:Zn-dependent peptidase ImmA (M78 family)